MTRERLLAIVEATLDEALPRPGERPAVLSDAMRYAVGSGGKRIRPLVCLASAAAAGGSAEDARHPAAAVEILHNYTLVHDDLPAMDADEERRGRPTVWKKFGEANAILVGDALLALAFREAAKSPRNVADIVGVIGEAGVGVVSGQVEDLRLTRENAPFVYGHKTADLFVAAAKAGALAAGGAPEAVSGLGRFAFCLGLAFQHEDDVLDGDGPYGAEESTRLAEARTAEALAALEGLPGDTSFLRGLAASLVGRGA